VVALKPDFLTDALEAIQRSRNAVVALKRICTWITRSKRPGKQERRGGIETGINALPRRLPNWKQERRGGIETRGNGRSLRSHTWEAGTPWWH